jgi:hypothetical protein
MRTWADEPSRCGDGVVAMSSWTDDEGLMRHLTQARDEDDAALSPRRRAAHRAFAWRSGHRDLMLLTHDSVVEADRAVRGVPDVRALAFEGGGLTLEVFSFSVPPGSIRFAVEVDGQARRTPWIVL